MFVCGMTNFTLNEYDDDDDAHLICELNSAAAALLLVDIDALENGHLVGTLPAVDGFVWPAAGAEPTDDAASVAACWPLLNRGVDGPETGTFGAALRCRAALAPAAEYCGPPRAGHDGAVVVGAGLGPPACSGAPVIHA